MEAYPDIPGPTRAPRALCTAFYKFDGSQLRFGWSRKKGWHKFGTRSTLFDHKDRLWGWAIELFNKTYAEPLTEIIRKNKKYRDSDRVLAFCEALGPSSFAGTHDFDELRSGKGELVLFDIWIPKHGIIPPRDFIKDFGRLRVPEVIYEGNFNEKFIRDVLEGKYPVKEGVVAKGVENQRLWMAKIKTRWWFGELKRRAAKSAHLEKLLTENTSEQGANYVDA